MQETRALLAFKDNDFSWSSWVDHDQALSEIDSIIIQLEHGSVPDMRFLFAPTGPIQEVSLSSGWGEDFLKLAEQFDKEYANARNQL